MQKGLYTGELCSGKPNGEGIFVTGLGDKYQGFFEHGVMEGNFVIYDNSGSTAAGKFAEGRRHGRFLLTRPSGNKFYYFYRRGALQSGPIPESYMDNYVGEYDDIGQRSGFGELTLAFPLSFTYKGHWLKNEMSGKGSYTFGNGDYYIGEFLNNRYHGEGELLIVDEYKYAGQWVDGRKSGKGKIVWFADESFFDGIFEAGIPHGLGICGDIEASETYECEYRNGKKVK
ncbi:hypothetical protein GCM10025776_21280 [Corallincola platygyrae]